MYKSYCNASDVSDDENKDGDYNEDVGLFHDKERW